MGFWLNYLIVRTLVWLGVTALLGATLLRSKQKGPRPSRVLQFITLSTGLFTAQRFWELATLAAGNGAFFMYNLSMIDALTKSAFLGLLLMISGGYCITIPRMKELERYVFVLPSVFFAASVVSGLLIEFSREHDRKLSDTGIYIALVSGLIQSVIAVMSWMSVLESSERVAKYLEEIAPRSAQQQAEASVRTFQLSPDEDDSDGFQPVPDKITTVAEEVERMNQARLMRNFKLATTVYMIAFVIAFFAPLFGKDNGQQESQAAATVEAVWNSLLLLFLLALAWVFRPQSEDNAYLFVGEDDALNVHLDTRIELQGMPVIPELPDEDASLQESPSPQKALSPAASLSKDEPAKEHPASANGVSNGATSSTAETNGVDGKVADTEETH